MNKAYLIHARDFRETSLLIDFFTKEHGFIKAVARGVRTNSKRSQRGLLQPFTPLFINWRGNSDLVTLNNFELAAQPLMLVGNKLIFGFYLNELLYYLLNKYSGLCMEGLFDKYEQILKNINNYNNSLNDNIESFLRSFELDLLEAMGYGLQFDSIVAQDYYLYSFTEGFYQVNHDVDKAFKGIDLLALKNREWHKKNVLLVAKVLLRQILQYHIGNKELNSRKLFFIE